MNWKSSCGSGAISLLLRGPGFGDADDRDLGTVHVRKRLDGGRAGDEIGAFDHKIGRAKIDARSALIVRQHEPDLDCAGTAGIRHFFSSYNDNLDGYAKHLSERAAEVAGRDFVQASRRALRSWAAAPQVTKNVAGSAY
jgi:hypothetical protein